MEDLRLGVVVVWFVLRGVVLTCGLSTLTGHNLPGFPVRQLYDIMQKT